jgi:integrase
MAKFPYLTGRKGTRNLYYKREVPPELRAAGRPSQIWRSLGTSDRKKAEASYGAKHAEVEALFAHWRKDDALPLGSHQAQAPAKSSLDFVRLTPALLRRLADFHYLDVYEADFEWRGGLWKEVHEDESAFWDGKIIKLPEDDWCEFRGKQYSYFALLMEEPVIEDVFLYTIFWARKAKLQRLKRQYALGDSREHESGADALVQSKGISLNDADRRRLMRKLMEVEIKALEDLTASNEATFDGIVERQSTAETSTESISAPQPGELMSGLIEKYLDDTSREREWPAKTLLRKRGELREFLEIAGDKSINAYRQADGVNFKDIQLALPIYRQKPPFKGLALTEAAKKATELRARGEKVDLLNPITINDKIGTVSLFFEWAKSRDGGVVNPVADLRMQRAKNKRKAKKLHPWTIDELNRMFAAPIYTGCRSERYWREPGGVMLRQSAKYWVPLIGLFSGMRLGEIVQLQVTDVKCLDGIEYFDVTPLTLDPNDNEAEGLEEKSLKTAASRRGIPIHQTLFDLGFGDFLEMRRASGERRLFPDYERAKDDESWSKQFSKYFKRFRESIGVTRRGVKFHSLRHNVEDMLRNTDVRKEVRDAIQGHGEAGVSREYGSGYYVKTLNEAVQKIEYHGLRLPRSKRETDA